MIYSNPKSKCRASSECRNTRNKPKGQNVTLSYLNDTKPRKLIQERSLIEYVGHFPRCSMIAIHIVPHPIIRQYARTCAIVKASMRSTMT